jgi:hypothetical protein
MRSTKQAALFLQFGRAGLSSACLSAKTEVWTAFVGLYLFLTEPTKTRE